MPTLDDRSADRMPKTRRWRRAAALVACIAVVGTTAVAAPLAAQAASTDTMLTDLTPLSQSNGWGDAREDRSLDGNPITLAGTTYDTGWGTNARSEIVYELNDQYKRFISDVGIDDEVGSNGSVQFVVYGDGEELWRSSTMTGDSPTQTVDVDVSTVNMLSLVVDDLGDLSYDHGDWANPTLTSTGNPIVGFYATRDGSKVPYDTDAAVSYGTSEADALATLDTEGFSLFRDGTYFSFLAQWSFDEPYDPTVPGPKAVTATIESGSNAGTVTATKTGILTVLPQSALPAPWADTAIGDSVGGSARAADGVFTVAGSGSDIWNRQSGFHYAFQQFSGDVQVTARVDELTDTNEWAKAGVMISDGLGADAKFAALIATPRERVGFERRLSVGADTDYVQGAPSVPALPVWLTLSRSGDTFTARYSSDGTTWSEGGSVDIDMGSSVYVGLAVTSHDTAQVATARFSEVSVEAAAADKTALRSAIALSEQTRSQTGIGDQFGQAPPAAVDALDAALQPARATEASEDTRQQQVDQATNDLVAALETFQRSTNQSSLRPFIPNDDLNGSGTSTVGDLGIATALAATGGDTSRLADVNNDGTVDAADLSAIADDISMKSAPAATPPMGWNSWDVYANTVNEAQLRAHTDYVAANLKQFGWQYIVNDIQWYNRQANGSYDMEAPVMDEFGRLMPAVNRFPSAADGAGFTPLAEYMHGKGLKFGIHIMRGIPRAAVNAKLPIKGTPYTADQIADTGSFAWWNGDMWGIDASKPGAQEYVDSLFELYAQWGIDFIKIDDLSAPTYHQAEVELYRNAIDKVVAQTGREIVFSTSPGNTPIAAGPHVEDHANMWRMSNDFWDNWPAMREMYELTAQWTPFRGPGHWPDADMLPLGKLEIRTDPYTGAEREGRMTRFTKDEQTSMLTLWSMAKSPLILGNDLRVLDQDPWTKALITNRAVLHVNQASTDNELLYRRGDILAWTAKAADGSTYLSHNNLTAADTVMSTTLNELGLPTTARYMVYDLWNDITLGTVTGDQSIVSTVPTHGARLLQLVDLSKDASFTDAPITDTPYDSSVAAAPSADGPSVTLSASGTPTVGQKITVAAGVSGVTGSSTAQEVVVDYDADALQLGTVEAARAGISIVGVDTSKTGRVRVMVSSPGGVTGTDALADLTFTVTKAMPTATATATIADADGREWQTNAASAVVWGSTPTPTPTPSATPTATPTAEPTATPTATPTAEPTVSPTATPTAEPTATPTTEPTVSPTATPTAEPTAQPTATPTAQPTATPTAQPTAQPTAEPTATPTVTPTAQPSATPAPTATAVPSASPTAKPAVRAQLSAQSVTPGSTITVTGSGYAAAESVEIWLHSTPAQLWSGKADAEGTLSRVVRIPAGTSLGDHQIEVRGAGSGSIWLTVKVVDRLAATGADTSGLGLALGLGTGALLLGGAMVFLVRRRRRAEV